MFNVYVVPSNHNRSCMIVETRCARSTVFMVCNNNNTTHNAVTCCVCTLRVCSHILIELTCCRKSYTLYVLCGMNRNDASLNMYSMQNFTSIERRIHKEVLPFDLFVSFSSAKQIVSFKLLIKIK